MARHALHYHDRIVHDDADRQDDSEQGRKIDAEAQRGHGREGTMIVTGTVVAGTSMARQS
jgi:hypothetical protein